MNFCEILEEKARWEQHKDAVCYFKQILEAVRQNSSCTATYLASHKLSKEDKPDILGTAGCKNEIIREILLWITTYGHISVGQQAKTYSPILCEHWMPSRVLAKNDVQKRWK